MTTNTSLENAPSSAEVKSSTYNPHYNPTELPEKNYLRAAAYLKAALDCPEQDASACAHFVDTKVMPSEVVTHGRMEEPDLATRLEVLVQLSNSLGPKSGFQHLILGEIKAVLEDAVESREQGPAVYQLCLRHAPVFAELPKPNGAPVRPSWTMIQKTMHKFMEKIGNKDWFDPRTLPDISVMQRQMSREVGARLYLERGLAHGV